MIKQRRAATISQGVRPAGASRIRARPQGQGGPRGICARSYPGAELRRGSGRRQGGDVAPDGQPVHRTDPTRSCKYQPVRAYQPLHSPVLARRDSSSCQPRLIRCAAQQTRRPRSRAVRPSRPPSETRFFDARRGLHIVLITPDRTVPNDSHPSAHRGGAAIARRHPSSPADRR